MKKKELINVLSLFIVQGSNAILPILVFPIILSRLGNFSYSKIVITESIIFIPYAFILYSFEVNGVSTIIKHIVENKINKISELFSQIFIIRLLIFILSLILILISGFFINQINLFLMLIWLMFPLSYIFQNSYFYLGYQNNFPLAVSVFFSRIICFLLIYYLLNKNSSVYLAPLLIGLSFMVSGLFSFIYILIKHKIKLSLPNYKELKYQIIEGKEIFFGNISVLLFKDINVLIVSLITKDTNLISSYSIAEKIVKSLQASLRPINQFFYPKGLILINNIKETNNKAFNKIFSVTKIQLTLIFFIISSFFLGVNYLQDYELFSFLEYNKNIISLIGIMIFSIFFGVLNFMYGTLGLNHLGQKRYFAMSIFLTGLVSFVTLLIFTKYFSIYGTAANYVLSEIILLFFILYKFKL